MVARIRKRVAPGVTPEISDNSISSFRPSQLWGQTGAWQAVFIVWHLTAQPCKWAGAEVKLMACNMVNEISKQNMRVWRAGR